MIEKSESQVPSDIVAEGENDLWEQAPIVAKTRRLGCARYLLALVMMLFLIAAAIWFAIAEAQKVPDFYANVLKSDEAAANEYGRQFESNLVRLQNSARSSKPWRIEITEEQINGWFASDLPEKFPDSIPNEVQDPRVVFTEEEVKIAFKYDRKSVSGIVVIAADVFCTDKPNEIAIEVKDVRAGFVPLPVGPWMEKVSLTIRKLGVPLYWLNEGKSTVAVFSLPEHLTAKGDNRQVVIDAIELRTGKLILAGSTMITKSKTKEKIQTGTHQEF